MSRTAFALDQRVREERGRVDDSGEVPGLEGAVGQDRADSGHDGADRIVVGRQNLATPLPAGVVVVHDDVGERASDVDSERIAGHRVKRPYHDSLTPCGLRPRVRGR